MKCIGVFEGRFPENGDIPPGYNKNNGYALVLGGTKNGQIVLYSTKGAIVDRYQVSVVKFINVETHKI